LFALLRPETRGVSDSSGVASGGGEGSDVSGFRKTPLLILWEDCSEEKMPGMQRRLADKLSELGRTPFSRVIQKRHYMDDPGESWKTALKNYMDSTPENDWHIYIAIPAWTNNSRGILQNIREMFQDEMNGRSGVDIVIVGKGTTGRENDLETTKNFEENWKANISQLGERNLNLIPLP